MANTNPSPNEILTALRDYGLDVKPYSGGGRSWDTVGRAWNANGGGLYGAVVHHTAARTTGYSGAPSLVWAQQYPGYPACNLLVGRGKGDTYLLSAGSCYHSGLGGPWPEIGINSAGNTGHFRLWGIEIEATVTYTTESGATIPESVPYITEYQEEQVGKTCAALWDLCGWPSSKRIVTHGDWTDSGPYLGTGSYGPHRYRKTDTRRSTHSGKFWQKKAEEYKEGGGGSSPNPGGGDEDKDKNPNNVVNLSKTIDRSAVAVSEVAGTPQTARFALLNMSNESIYLSEGDTGVLTGSGSGILWVKARTIVEGDSKEVSEVLNDKSGSGELIIEAPWVQDQFTAEAALSFVVSSFKTKYRSIEASIFGNPLIQIGDIAKFTSDINKIDFGSSQYYYVSKVSHSFDEDGLSTTVQLNPVTKIL